MSTKKTDHHEEKIPSQDYEKMVPLPALHTPDEDHGHGDEDDDPADDAFLDEIDEDDEFEDALGDKEEPFGLLESVDTRSKVLLMMPSQRSIVCEVVMANGEIFLSAAKAVSDEGDFDIKAAKALAVDKIVKQLKARK